MGVKKVKTLLAIIVLIVILSQTRLSYAASWTWSSTEVDNTLQVYGTDGQTTSQYAVIHYDGCQLRLVYGPNCDWGTSLYLTPAFLVGGQLKQGGHILQKTTSVDGVNFVIDFVAENSGLTVTGEVKIYPPAKEAIAAEVEVTDVSGDVTLDNRPNEAFQFAKLSSMHISETIFDTSLSFAGCDTNSIPSEGWMIPGPDNAITTNRFGTIGGLSLSQQSTSERHVPSYFITLDRSAPVTGWVTFSELDSNDNIGYWASSPTVLRSWSIRIHVNNRASHAVCQFTDVSPEYWDYDETILLADYGITKGCSEKLYCPENKVKRSEMALFLGRAIGGLTDYIPPPCGEERFSDVPCDYAAYKAIEFIADGQSNPVHQPITIGCTSTSFCPDGNVTRAEMALFLARAVGGFSDYSPQTSHFSDVPESFSEVYRAVEYIYDAEKNTPHRSITKGCTPETYCPQNQVRRDEMAAFLARAFLGAI